MIMKMIQMMKIMMMGRCSLFSISYHNHHYICWLFLAHKKNLADRLVAQFPPAWGNVTVFAGESFPKVEQHSDTDNAKNGAENDDEDGDGDDDVLQSVIIWPKLSFIKTFSNF